MANIEYGLFKVAAVKISGMAFPIGVVAVAAIWAWRTRDRRSLPPHRDDSSDIGAMGAADAGASPRETSTAHASADQRASYRPATGAPLHAGNDREALLSRIIEDNIRLREALK